MRRSNTPIRQRPPAPPPPPSRAPVRLGAARCPSPFAPGRAIAFARVEGEALGEVGLHEGDHVALARDQEVERDEVAAVVGDDGTSALWAAHRDGVRLRLCLGDRTSLRVTARHPRVAGVVIAVLRRGA